MINRYFVRKGHAWTEPNGAVVDDMILVLASEYDAIEIALKASGAGYEKAQARIAELETALRGLYGECCYAGHDTDSDYAWPSVMDQAKRALTPNSQSDRPEASGGTVDG